MSLNTDEQSKNRLNAIDNSLRHVWGNYTKPANQ